MKSRLAFRNGTPQTRTFRKFNRFYTALIGTLSRDYLQTRYSLQEARVIYEVASNPCCTAKEIQTRTNFDQGYLSRLIARLAEAKLLVGKRSTKDGRAQNLFLTTAGKKAFRLLNDRADDQAHGLTSHLNPEQIQRLCDAFGVIESLLDSPARPEPIIIREQRVGDLGWTFHRQAVVYSREFKYRDLFEKHVCQGLCTYLEDYDRRRDRLWVAEIDGRPVGFVAVHHVNEQHGLAKLRWFLVEKEVRGRGVGSRLLGRAIAFCKLAGYTRVFLWTVSDLESARMLYQKAGFKLTEEKTGCEWAPRAKEQRWDLQLKA